VSAGGGTTLAWVVGRGGLLGSHLGRCLSAPGQTEVTPWVPPPEASFSWDAPHEVRAQLAEVVGGFFAAVRAGGHRAWIVYWAAGAGIVGSTAAALAAESETFASTLNAIAARLDRGGPPGLVFLASSAGGVYGRCPDSPATEVSPCLPISDYGRAKLRQEGLLATWAEINGVSHLVGRISNLYGPGQNLDKPQGLITHLVRSLVLDRPVHLYVSLDTLRDYIHADDCAAGIVRASVQVLRAAEAGGGPRAVTKIFASEQATSISALIGIISRVTRRRPQVVYAAPRALSEQQPRRLTFRSLVLRPDVHAGQIGLPVGVSQVHRHLLALFRAGKLAPRPPAT
jgi:UDP-glucose 4-epimerase